MARQRNAARGGASRGRSQRQLRVGELIRHALAEVLARGEVRDPALDGVSITVSEVRTSPDMRHATCFVMPLGGAEREEVMAALARSAPWLSGQVARRVTMKYTPRLRFELDQSYDEASRVDALLRRPDVARDLGAETADGAGDDGDGA